MRRQTRRWAARFAVLACAAAGVIAMTPERDGVEVAQPPGLRFLAYNICGSGGSRAFLCTDDMTNASRGEVPARAGEVERQVAEWNPDAVFLNEVCRNQYDAMDEKLETSGYTGLFVRTATTANCWVDGGAGSADAGLALFARNLSPLPARRLDPPGAVGEQYYLLCGDTTAQGTTIRVCSTHWTASDPAANRYQADQVEKIVNPWLDAGIPVVLGGDLNVEPGDETLDHLYTRFAEVGAPCADCRSGEATYDQWKPPADRPDTKLDYIFLSRDHFTGLSGDAVDADPTVTDHQALRGAARLRRALP
ncbi:endonuclease/exonuclease/phosphatase family protein [Actinoplanes sp. NPDC048796]|uniref:endonuclease/exonuclease/phosphatase family protein n=1 Tax=Actinoplanes sp. NPDC048796 TaxID=3155640 RepID=UPI0033C5C75B